MKRITISAILFFIILASYAQETRPISNWSFRFAFKGGLSNPIGRWNSLFPYQRIIGKNVFLHQTNIGAAYRLNPRWSILLDIGYQYSKTREVWAITPWGTPSQNKEWVIMIPLQVEFQTKWMFLDAGLFAGYEVPTYEFDFIQQGIVQKSRWQIGPIAEIGYRQQMNENLSLRLGLQLAWGIVRYYNYHEQYNVPPEQRQYDHHAKPSFLLSLQLEYTPYKRKVQKSDMPAIKDQESK